MSDPQATTWTDLKALWGVTPEEQADIDRRAAKMLAEAAVEKASDALFSVGSQDMPVGGYEVREAMDAFEKAVRLDQSLVAEAPDPVLVIASALARLDYPEGRSQHLYLVEEVNNLLVTLEIEFNGQQFLTLALDDPDAV